MPTQTAGPDAGDSERRPKSRSAGRSRSRSGNSRAAKVQGTRSTGSRRRNSKPAQKAGRVPPGDAIPAAAETIKVAENLPADGAAAERADHASTQLHGRMQPHSVPHGHQPVISPESKSAPGNAHGGNQRHVPSDDAGSVPTLPRLPDDQQSRPAPAASAGPFATGDPAKAGLIRPVAAGPRPVLRTGPKLASRFGRRSFGGKTIYRQQFRPSSQSRTGDGSSAGYSSPTNQPPAPAPRSSAAGRSVAASPSDAAINPVKTPSLFGPGSPELAAPAADAVAMDRENLPSSTESVEAPPDISVSEPTDASDELQLNTAPDVQSEHAASSEAGDKLADGRKPAARRGRIMLVNAVDTDECRIAILSQGILDEFYIERGSNDLHVGNIYKGRVTNVEPAIQAAFIDFGISKNGFLHISDLHPQYFPKHLQQRWHTAALRAAQPSAGSATDPTSEISSGEAGGDNVELAAEPEELIDPLAVENDHIAPMERVGRKTPRASRPPIQQCLRRGQEIIVQVTKEGIGTKGPSLTSYVSVPGRYLVMMPGMSQLGVSRKVVDDQQRRQMKQVLREINPPKNLGFIIRTAGVDKSADDLKTDLLQLLSRWRDISQRIDTQPSPALLYEESDLLTRTMRDLDFDGIERVIVDNPTVLDRIGAFLSGVESGGAQSLELFTEPTPLFSRYGVERELERINSRRVEMANGGSLVFDSTEALVAVDVNSGRYREHRDAEMTAFKVNQEAVREICRQLKLRDLGGVIVIDFIDMREERHKRDIENLLRDELKKDRAKTKVLRMSQFCMIELTRQRMKPSLKRSIYMDCPHCHGAGLIKNPESVSLDVLRRIAAAAMHSKVATLEVKVYTAVADYLLNKKRRELIAAEDRSNRKISIVADEQIAGDQVVITATDARGVDLHLEL